MDKHYLNKGYGLKKEIDILSSVIEEIRTNLDGIKGISYSGIKVEGGPVKDESFILDKLVKIEEITQEITDKKYELILFQGELLEMINKIEDVNERNVLYLRYILNLKWEEVAERMGYDVRQIYRVHKKYLKNSKSTINA